MKNNTVQLSREELQPMLELFHSLHPIGKGVEQFLLKHMYSRKISRGDFLVANGEICDSIFYMKTGALRGFISEDNKEVTTWLTVEGEIVATISGFLLQISTMENIQAIEDCDMIGIRFEDLERLYLQYPSFNIVGRKITEQYYMYAENRAYITRLHDAQKKYEIFMRLYSHLLNRIPLKYIASFLGITLETLSRVRAKAASKKKQI